MWISAADYAETDIHLDSLSSPIDLPVSSAVEIRGAASRCTRVSGIAAPGHGTDRHRDGQVAAAATLSGNYGGAAVKFADMFSPGSIVWSLAASVTQPLFKGGQLVHERRAAAAAAQEAAANYKATVLVAFQNVSDTLYALHGDAAALAAQASAERSAAGSLELVQAQYKAGGASFLQVLAAEQTYQWAAVALVKARAQRYADTAALFQALGGGSWHPRRHGRQFNRFSLRIFANIMQSATPQDGTPVKFKGMIKPLVIVILAVAIVLGGIFGWQAFIASMIKNMMAGASAPVTVSAITATATKWQAQMQAVGTLRAVRGADFRPGFRRRRSRSSSTPATMSPAGKVLLQAQTQR